MLHFWFLNTLLLRETSVTTAGLGVVHESGAEKCTRCKCYTRYFYGRGTLSESHDTSSVVRRKLDEGLRHKSTIKLWFIFCDTGTYSMYAGTCIRLHRELDLRFSHRKKKFTKKTTQKKISESSSIQCMAYDRQM